VPLSGAKESGRLNMGLAWDRMDRMGVFLLGPREVPEARQAQLVANSRGRFYRPAPGDPAPQHRPRRGPVKIFRRRLVHSGSPSSSFVSRRRNETSAMDMCLCTFHAHPCILELRPSS
jgi:hypothetical protein